MKNKKIIIGVTIAFLSIIILLGGIALTIFLPLKDYLDETPKITPDPTITVAHGETLSVSDLCQVECKGNYTLSLSITETQIPDAVVSADKQSIYVGSSAGVIIVEIMGRGENAESRCVNARILVDLD